MLTTNAAEHWRGAPRGPCKVANASSRKARVGASLGTAGKLDGQRGSVEGRSVDELLDPAVEGLAFDQLEIEVGRVLEDRLHPGLAGDHREDRHLDAVDQTCGHKRPVH